jgi:hypothetical protein
MFDLDGAMMAGAMKETTSSASPISNGSDDVGFGAAILNPATDLVYDTPGHRPDQPRPPEDAGHGRERDAGSGPPGQPAILAVGRRPSWSPISSAWREFSGRAESDLIQAGIV